MASVEVSATVTATVMFFSSIERYREMNDAAILRCTLLELRRTMERSSSHCDHSSFKSFQMSMQTKKKLLQGDLVSPATTVSQRLVCRPSQ